MSAGATVSQRLADLLEIFRRDGFGEARKMPSAICGRNGQGLRAADPAADHRRDRRREIEPDVPVVQRDDRSTLQKVANGYDLLAQ